VDLILATRNAHKVREVSRVLAPYGITVEPLPDSVVLPAENGETFADNALPKARTAAHALGRPAIADDSGIEAAALGGRPGVRSARYAGERATDGENLAKLLAEAPGGSGLRYVCALAFVDPAFQASDGGERVFIGESRGRLAARPRGERGFGYDPAFLPDDGPPEMTMAELDDLDKDAISHRGRALRAFAEWYSR
jgi:XTP/dITP diphosphohydrolase